MDIVWLNAALKGILQGFTEFLPISSTGHLILARDLLPLGPPGPARDAFERTFDIVIQLPSILAVVILYRARLWKSVRGVAAEPAARRFWGGLFLAFLPAAVVGLLAHHWIEEHLERPIFVAQALLAGGIIILILEKWGPAGGPEKAEDVPWWKAAWIGIFQCFALVPGTSRSGATIIGARALNLNREAAAEYSFFLAIPTMFAACGYKFAKSWHEIPWATDALPLAVGSVFSFVTAYIVIAAFLKFVRTRTLSAFGWYRIVLGAMILALWFAGVLKEAS